MRWIFVYGLILCEFPHGQELQDHRSVLFKRTTSANDLPPPRVLFLAEAPMRVHYRDDRVQFGTIATSWSTKNVWATGVDQ